MGPVKRATSEQVQFLLIHAVFGWVTWRGGLLG
jgi:hypothetical protein